MTISTTSFPWATRVACRLAISVMAMQVCGPAAAAAAPSNAADTTQDAPHAPEGEELPGEVPLGELPTERLRDAALRGNAAAMACLGSRYVKGQGVAQSDAMAAYWYGRSAQAGSLEGMVLFGWALAFGEGVPQDEAQAAAWFRRAADLDSTLGMVSLAWLFERGRGVEQDLAQALLWYRRAAAAGSELGEREVRRLQASP
jgi:TPR repeat protein